MKIDRKEPAEIIAELQIKVSQQESYITDLVEIIKSHAKDMVEIKLENTDRLDKLHQKMTQRDEILKDQAIILKGIATAVKEGAKSSNGLTKEDINYIMHLVKKSDAPVQKKVKNSWYNNLFKKG